MFGSVSSIVNVTTVTVMLRHLNLTLLNLISLAKLRSLTTLNHRLAKKAMSFHYLVSDLEIIKVFKASILLIK